MTELPWQQHACLQPTSMIEYWQWAGSQMAKLLPFVCLERVINLFHGFRLLRDGGRGESRLICHFDRLQIENSFQVFQEAAEMEQLWKKRSASSLVPIRHEFPDAVKRRGGLRRDGHAVIGHGQWESQFHWFLSPRVATKHCPSNPNFVISLTWQPWRCYLWSRNEDVTLFSTDDTRGVPKPLLVS